MGKSTHMRLSRREMQENTRARLIAAATDIIAAGGVAAASIRGICETAGYSQGAFYSNFESMDDLLIEVMERHVRDEASILRQRVSDADPTGPEEALQLLARHLAALAALPHWARLSIELKLHAERDPQFAARYRAGKVACHGELAVLVADILSRHHLVAQLTPLQIATVLHALWSGLAIEGDEGEPLPREQILVSFLKAVAGPSGHEGPFSAHPQVS